MAQPDQARILELNARNFLKNGGHFVISIKVPWLLLLFSHPLDAQANCIDSTVPAEAVFNSEIKKLQVICSIAA